MGDYEAKVREHAAKLKTEAAALLNKPSKPKGPADDRCARLRDAQQAYLVALDELCTQGPELSEARTAFERSCLWAILSITQG